MKYKDILKLNNSQSEFFKNVLSLLSGSAIASIISFSLWPILTRIFSPEQFGLFYIYSSIINSLHLIVTGRYEIAILLPEKDKSALHIAVGAFLIASLSCFALFIFFSLFNFQISEILNSKALSSWLYFIPGVVLLIASNQIASYWLLRNKAFKASSYIKVTQSALTGAGGTLLGTLRFSNGLIWGDIIGKIGVLIMSILQMKRIGFSLNQITKSDIKKELKHYNYFPRYNAIPSFLDNFTLNLPTILVNAFYNSSLSSFFNFPRQILGTPLSLISSSVSQVLFQRISLKKNNQESIMNDMLNVLKLLSLISIVFLFITLFFSEDIFAFIFGEKWRIAGHYAKFLSVSIAIKFIVSPLSIIFPSLNAIKVGSAWQVLYFILTCVLFLCGEMSILNFMIVYILIDLVVYLFYLYLIFRAVMKYENNIRPSDVYQFTK
jgi:O-antigen/teichoic acid export membrane protein